MQVHEILIIWNQYLVWPSIRHAAIDWEFNAIQSTPPAVPMKSIKYHDVQLPAQSPLLRLKKKKKANTRNQFNTSSFFFEMWTLNNVWLIVCCGARLNRYERGHFIDFLILFCVVHFYRTKIYLFIIVKLYLSMGHVREKQSCAYHIFGCLKISSETVWLKWRALTSHFWLSVPSKWTFHIYYTEQITTSMCAACFAVATLLYFHFGIVFMQYLINACFFYSSFGIFSSESRSYALDYLVDENANSIWNRLLWIVIANFG